MKNFDSSRAFQKHVCTLHSPNKKRRDDVSLSRQEGSRMHHLANAHSATFPAGGNTERLFLSFGGTGRADQYSTGGDSILQWTAFR